MNSTLEMTGFGANSTKIDDSQIEDDNDDAEGETADAEAEQEPEVEAEAETETYEKVESVETANDNQVTTEAIEVSHRKFSNFSYIQYSQCHLFCS